jgi:hypothetical protein
MKKFLGEAAENKELQSELRRVIQQNFAEIAKRRGYDLKPEDFDAGKKLSLEELAAVAGGAACGCFLLGVGDDNGNEGGKANCICALVGTATGDDSCFCFVVGASK